MKYLLLVYLDEKAMLECAESQNYDESLEVIWQLKSTRHYVAAAPLQPVSTAVSIRVRDGNVLVTDGPFAETREQLGGYYLIEASNRDEAVEIAKRIPGARAGTVEVRPLVEIPELASDG